MAARTDVRVESVEELLSRQVVVPAWMREAVAGLAPTALVRVERAYALGAGYVLRVDPVEPEQQPAPPVVPPVRPCPRCGEVGGDAVAAPFCSVDCAQAYAAVTPAVRS